MSKPEDQKQESSRKDDRAKWRRKYELNDKIVDEKVLFDCVRGRTINNEKGYYVDVRKYFNNHPSSKGIRLRIDDCRHLVEYLQDVIQKIQNENK